MYVNIWYQYAHLLIFITVVYVMKLKKMDLNLMKLYQIS